MSGFAYALESDERFENDESDEFFENDESDEFAEARGRFAARRNAPRIATPPTAPGRGLFRPRPAPGGGAVVTEARLEMALMRVESQIATNSTAIKKVASQANTITSELRATTGRLDKQVGDLKKEVKKQAETSLLLTLLQPKVELEATNPSANTGTAGQVVSSVGVKKQNNLLPLLLLSGSGGLGGGSGDNSSFLFLALALSGQL